MIAKRLFAESLTKINDGSDGSHGRFRLNAGSIMTLDVPGLNDKGPIHCVVDMATAKFRNPRIVALYFHENNIVIGYWDNATITPEGGIEADFHLLKPENEIEANVMQEAVMIGVQLKGGAPIQVSVGAEPGDGGRWEEVTTPIMLNGRTYEPTTDGIPLFALYGAEVYEASIVTFGADELTGKLAAAKKEVETIKGKSPMSNDFKFLATLAPKHKALALDLVAEGKTDDQIREAVAAEEKKTKDEEFNSMKAELESMRAAMKAKDESKEDEEEEEKEKAKGKKVAAAAKGSDKGVTFSRSETRDDKGDGPADMMEAQSVVMGEWQNKGMKIDAVKIRAEARRRFGDLPNMTEAKVASIKALSVVRA